MLLSRSALPELKDQLLPRQSGATRTARHGAPSMALVISDISILARSAISARRRVLQSEVLGLGDASAVILAPAMTLAIVHALPMTAAFR